MRAYIKRISFLSVLAVLLLFLSACDTGLRFEKIELVTVPYKTSYTTGEDEVLDFTGGQIRLTTLDGRTEDHDFLWFTYHKESNRFPCICSDVNFAIPGEYTVTIWQSDTLYCQYTIVVQSDESSIN